MENQLPIPLEQILDNEFQAELVELYLNGITRSHRDRNPNQLNLPQVYTLQYLQPRWQPYASLLLPSVDTTHHTIADRPPPSWFSFLTVSRRRRGHSNNRAIALVTVVMFSLSTLGSAAYWYQNRKLFVFEGSSLDGIPRGPALHPQAISLWAFLCRTLSFSLNTLVADCLLIWRSWIIWGRDWRVVILPSILTIVGTVFSVLSDIAQTDIAIEDINSKTDHCFASSKFFTETGTIYLALSFGTTLVVTTLIIYRILAINSTRRTYFRETSSGGASISTLPRLTNAIEILVESSLLYAISILVLLILLVKGSPSYMYAQAVVAQITGLAPTLILTRITLGHARPSKNWTMGGQDTLTQIQFTSQLGHFNIERNSSIPSRAVIRPRASSCSACSSLISEGLRI